jgi:hypothetical protein
MVIAPQRLALAVVIESHITFTYYILLPFSESFPRQLFDDED